MSDSEDSTVTYTEVSGPFEDLSDIGSPGVDGLPMMLHNPYNYVDATLQALPSPDYVPGPEHPPTSAFILEPVYPEFMPLEDDVLPAKEQPLHDPADNPLDKDDDDDDEESSRDEADDEEEDEDEKEEEEHLTPADSVPPPVHCVTAKMSIRAQTPISLPSETEVAILLAILTPPPSPLSPWLRAESPSTYHPLPSSTPPSKTLPLLPIPLPTSSPPLLLPSTSHRVDVPEVTLPPQKRLCIGLGLRFEVGESSSAPTARPTGDTWDKMLVGMLGAPVTDEAELGRRMTDFVTTVRQDTDEIYGRLDDAQDDKLLMSGQLNMLRRDRRAHARTARLI
uniref:Reverse transcriptase domain-containing protein n=1 Tax=Tanacetum cinerariifolium TaxID=118510 RepID=A0A699KTB6_TANCI|nr:hypothetical protein [Tanacetum cinerariifolium]